MTAQCQFCHPLSFVQLTILLEFKMQLAAAITLLVAMRKKKYIYLFIYLFIEKYIDKYRYTYKLYKASYFPL